MQRQKTSAEGATENVERLHHRLREGGASMSTRHSVAKNENRFSFIVATLVASVQPKNEKRQINAANGSIIVGYARAENGAVGRQHKAVGA